ncbi:MAG: cobalamin biosynthesis protein, partial [Sciscionella sp.]
MRADRVRVSRNLLEGRMIGLFAVTAAGRASAAELAIGLGQDAVVVDGPIRPALRRLWPQLGAAVFFLATGATVRLVAELLADKRSDPGIVCVDEAGRFAVALAGGHAGGANALAERVAEIMGATPVITTASDATASTPLDELAESLAAVVDGDLASCAVAVLDGLPVRIVNPLGFPLPPLPDNVTPGAGSAEWTVVIDDRLPVRPVAGKTLRLIPRTLIVGIGSARAVPTDAVSNLLARMEPDAGLDLRAVRAFATIDLKAGERGICEAVQRHEFWTAEAGVALLSYPAATLSTVEVPNPSGIVCAEVGTPSVAEAAALHAAAQNSGGGPVELVMPKVKARNVTMAVARMRPRGRLAVVGLGPGAAADRTPRADAELRRASVVVGLESYVDQVRPVLRTGTEVRT